MTVGTEESGTGICDPPFETDEPEIDPEVASEVAFTRGRLSARAVPLRSVMQSRSTEIRASFFEIIRVPLSRV